MIDHDRLFKEMISTFFREFVELFLPEIMAQMTAASLTLLEKELFTDVTSGDRHVADLVARADLRESVESFIVHIEHQARSEADFGQRMFRYFCRLHEKHAIPIYPVVVCSFDFPKRPEPKLIKSSFWAKKSWFLSIESSS